MKITVAMGMPKMQFQFIFLPEKKKMHMHTDIQYLTKMLNCN